MYKKNLNYYFLLFGIVFFGLLILGNLRGILSGNFFIDIDYYDFITFVRLAFWSGIITTFPLMFLNKSIHRIFSFIVFILLIFIVEINLRTYSDLVSIIILINFGVIDTILFLIFLGLDYIKNKSPVKTSLIVIFLILFLLSVPIVYATFKAEYESRNKGIILPAAIKNQNCGGISNSWLRNECFVEVAVKTSNPDLCNEISYEGYRMECYRKASPKVNISGSESDIPDYDYICENFDGIPKYNCLKEAGLRMLDKNYCYKIPEGIEETSTRAKSMRDECLSSIESAENELRELGVIYCDSPNIANKQDCAKFNNFAYDAIEKINISLCSFQYTSNVGITNECIIQFAIGTSNLELCKTLDAFEYNSYRGRIVCINNVIPNSNPYEKCHFSQERGSCLNAIIDQWKQKNNS